MRRPAAEASRLRSLPSPRRGAPSRQRPRLPRAFPRPSIECSRRGRPASPPAGTGIIRLRRSSCGSDPPPPPAESLSFPGKAALELEKIMSIKSAVAILAFAALATPAFADIPDGHAGRTSPQAAAQKSGPAPHACCPQAAAKAAAKEPASPAELKAIGEVAWAARTKRAGDDGVPATRKRRVPRPCIRPRQNSRHSGIWAAGMPTTRQRRPRAASPRPAACGRQAETSRPESAGALAQPGPGASSESGRVRARYEGHPGGPTSALQESLAKAGGAESSVTRCST